MAQRLLLLCTVNAGLRTDWGCCSVLLSRHLSLTALKHGTGETFGLTHRSCLCVTVHCNGVQEHGDPKPKM